jgi:hypothetical protein
MVVHVAHVDGIAAAVGTIRLRRRSFDDDDVRIGATRKIPQIAEALWIDLGRVDTAVASDSLRDPLGEAAEARTDVGHGTPRMNREDLYQTGRVGGVILCFLSTENRRNAQNRRCDRGDGNRTVEPHGVSASDD